MRSVQSPKDTGDFTPGANLSSWQIDRVMAFLATKADTNEKTLDNIEAWFKAGVPGAIAILALAIFLPSAAKAKDITVTFTDQEQQAFVQVMDAATRSGGLAATQGTVYFYNKLQAAISAANAPVQASDKPKVEPTDAMPRTPAGVTPN